jgi:hypothetical protein
LLVAFAGDEPALGIEAVAVGAAAVGAPDAELALGVHFHDAIASDVGHEDVPFRIDGRSFEERDDPDALRDRVRRDQAIGKRHGLRTFTASYRQRSGGEQNGKGGDALQHEQSPGCLELNGSHHTACDGAFP